MNIQILEEKFKDFSKEWDLLLTEYENKTIFHTPTWHEIWWNSFAGKADLKLLSVKNGEKLIGVAPLMIKENCLTFIGDTDLFDYHDVFVIDSMDISYQYLWTYIKSLTWNNCVFKSLPSNSNFLKFFTELKENDIQINIIEEDCIPVLNLKNSWEEYLDSLNKKRRHELKRKFRRLYNNSNVKQYYSQDISKFDFDLKEFFRLLKLSSSDKLDFLTNCTMINRC